MEEKLKQAVADGDVELVKTLFVECKSTRYHCTSLLCGQLLVTAASKGLIEICRVLLSTKHQIFIVHECVALECAIESESLEMFDVLLRNGVRASSFSKNDKTLFGFLVEKKWLEAVKLLLTLGIRPSKEDSPKVVHFAVSNKDVELYELLEKLYCRLYVDGKDESGLTALSRAVENQDIDGVRFLCKYRPRIDYDFLSSDFEKLSEEMIDLIVVKNRNHSQLIISDAAEFANFEFIKWYCENIEDKERLKPYGVRRAVERGLVETVMFLVKQNPKLFYKLAFRVAVANDQVTVVEKLLEHGYSPDISYDEKSEHTILQEAIARKNWGIAKLLIQNSSALDKKDSVGYTALHLALCYGNYEIIRLLLDLGATIDNTKAYGGTVLHCAVHSDEDEEEIFQLLLRYGANVNEEDRNGTTPLTLAVLYKKMVISKFLIKTIVEMKLDGKLVSEKNWKASEANVELSGYQVQCEREIKSLKEKKFVDSSLSYYSIKKIKKSDQLAAFANNKNIFEVLKSSEFEREFPIYGRAIVEHFEKGIVRKRGLDRFNAMFLYVARRATDVLPKLPITCINQIFSCLSDEDAENLTLL